MALRLRNHRPGWKLWTAIANDLAYAWEDRPDWPISFYIEPFGVCCHGTNCGFTTLAGCLQFAPGTWTPQQWDCSLNPCTPVCPGDVSPSEGDGTVNIEDLVETITTWGNCTFPNVCTADIDHNGAVNIDDLVKVITHWGACP